jgi:hypothetical protein
MDPAALVNSDLGYRQQQIALELLRAAAIDTPAISRHLWPTLFRPSDSSVPRLPVDVAIAAVMPDPL